MVETVKEDPEGWPEPWWENALLLGAFSLVGLDPRSSSGACHHIQLLLEEAAQWVGQSQLEARKLRVRLESKGEREQMLFGESGKRFSGSATCWWVPF